MAPCLLLADLPTPGSPEATAWLVGSLWALAAGTKTVWELVEKARGKVPIPVDTANLVTRPELASTRAEIEAEHIRLHKRINRIESTTVAELRSINRSLGRLEGAVGTGPESHSS